jgi:hypothetical protein
MMNDTFSIKNAVNIIFTSDFCILTFWAFGFFGLNQVALWRFVSQSYMKHQISPSITILFKTLYRHQSFQQIQKTKQRIDVFDPELKNEEENEHTFLSFFKSSTNILRTVSQLIPLISSNIRTLKVRPSAKHFWVTSVDSSVLEVEGRPFRWSSCNDSHSSLNFYAIQTHLFSRNILHCTHFSIFQTFQ